MRSSVGRGRQAEAELASVVPERDDNYDYDDGDDGDDNYGDDDDAKYNEDGNEFGANV